jgi:uncharacterized FlaG/YvyC family protein
MEYVVQVIESDTGKIEKEFKPQHSMRAAERLEDGVRINLNHEKYHTRIEKVRTTRKGKRK